MTYEILAVGLVGLFTTMSVLIGAYVGLFYSLPERLLSGILAFAAGSLIAALAIDLSYDGAEALLTQGFGLRLAWITMASGFALGAIIYYVASVFLESHGAALRFRRRLMEYTRLTATKPADARIGMLAKCALLKHLNPDDLKLLLPHMQTRQHQAGDTIFRAGDSGDTLHIIVEGSVDVEDTNGHALATLGPGEVFGEMALIDGRRRSATVIASGAATFLEIDKAGFELLAEKDEALRGEIHELARKRSLANLKGSNADHSLWARIYHAAQGKSGMPGETAEVSKGKGIGLAIIFGNILDTIPGCLVIGAKFSSFDNMSATLMVGMFLGGIPESAASATLLKRAGYSTAAVYRMWSTVILAGVVSAIAGKLFISDPDSLFAIVMQAIAAGAILAMVSHAMIPEAIHKGGSISVMPVVLGFLFALYLAIEEAQMRKTEPGTTSSGYHEEGMQPVITGHRLDYTRASA